MTIKECYDKMNANYDEAKSRLMSDRLIEKFMLKFPGDDTMNQLEEALKAKDYELSFRMAHTLKGVAANLAFSSLRDSASNLTERLRNDKTEPEEELVNKVGEDYTLIIETIKAYQGC